MICKNFSIITVTWNNAEGLTRTLDSIRHLRYEKKEVIVIDGASTDNTASVLDSNKDIITTYVSEKDNGIYNAMNKGITLASGDYIIFMNAGDCFADSDTLDIVNKYDGEILLGGSKYGDSVRLVKEEMTLYDVISLGINHQSTYYKTEILKKYRFDERFKLLADLKSVVEPMAKENIKVTCIPEILSNCEGGGISKQRWRDSLLENRRIINDVVDPYYKNDYVRFARINNSMLNDFALLSSFTSIFPVIRLLAKMMRFMNNHFKHIPVE